MEYNKKTSLEKFSLGTLKGIPTDIDSFEINKYTKGLKEFLVNCETPMTVAIQGDWGTGKTSIMKQVKKSLLGDNKDVVEIIEFNTWQYSQFNMDEDLALSLICELIESLKGDKGSVDKVKNILIAMSKIPISMSGLSGGNEIVDGLVEAFSKKISSLKEFKTEFQKLVDKKTDFDGLNSRKRRVIIFIDDLDRLVPAKAVELLEVLKLFLDCEGCVFILAIDSNVIIKGIKDKYGEDIAKDKGKAFFDKIIQVPFTVPLKQYDMKKFIQSALVNDISIFNSLDSKELLIIEKLILNSLGNNPRGIKRLFNHYSLLLYIQNIEDGVDVNQWSNREKIQLLSVLCLQLGFDNIYNTFLDMIELGKLKDELYNLESDWSSQEPGAINGEIVPLLKTEFIKIFLELFKENEELDIDSLEAKLTLSTSTSMIAQKYTVTGSEVFKEFWSEFSKFIKNKDFDYEHSGNEVKSRYYRVKNRNKESRHCEFWVNNSSVGLVYGDTKDSTFNQLLLDQEEQLKTDFSDYDVYIRQWGKNNYNNIPGIRIMNNSIGLQDKENWENIFTWFVDTLNSLPRLINAGMNK
jgi:KAP family P-loop domain.